MNNKQKRYVEEIQQQSLSRIRQRLNGFTESRHFGVGQNKDTSSTFDSSKFKSNGFAGKVEFLESQCQRLVLNINDLNSQKRKIANRINLLREDLQRNIGEITNSSIDSVKQLSQIVKSGIYEAQQRNKKIYQKYYQNVNANNKIKISIVEIRNKINQIEHRLGCNATAWHKI